MSLDKIANMISVDYECMNGCSQSDERLADLIRKKFLWPPSTKLPYNFTKVVKKKKQFLVHKYNKNKSESTRIRRSDRTAWNC